MKQLTQTEINKRAMIKALEKSLGIVTAACKAVDIARQTHYEWYKEDPEYKKAVDDVAEIALDFAEGKLYNQIEGGDTVATIFYLKTKGKKRGYIERHELTGADGQPVIWNEVKTYKPEYQNGSDVQANHRN